jgi:hypothetical protein
MRDDRSASCVEATWVTQSLIATSTTLHAELAAIIVRSRALLSLGHERRLSTTYPRLRPIAGGDAPDTSLIVEAIARGGACLECVVRKTGVPAAKVTEILQRLESIVVIAVGMDSCDGCLRLTRTYHLSDHTHRSTPARSSAMPSRPRLDPVDSLWRFLTEHRGKMFCSACLGVALGATPRLDRMLFVAEGRGARRPHGPCVTCGKDRLLCGLAP